MLAFTVEMMADRVAFGGAIRRRPVSLSQQRTLLAGTQPLIGPDCLRSLIQDLRLVGARDDNGDRLAHGCAAWRPA
jgi:hypothetical protein